MQHVKTVKLGEIFDFVRNGISIQQDTQASGYPITRIETISEGRIDITKVGFANILDLKSYQNYLLQEGDILLSHINSMKHLGKTAIYEGNPEILIHGMNLLCLRPNVNVLLPKFALHYLKSEDFLRQIPNIANQSVNQASVSTSSLKKLTFPLPDLDTQRHIAAVLNRADALRQKDRQLLAYYEALPQAVFLEMFGDPVRNEKGWERGTIRDLLTEAKYGTSKPAEANGTYPYLRMNNITYSGQWNLTDLKYINLDESEKVKYLAQKGDLLFNRTNSRELVGKTAVYKFDYPMAVAGYLVKARTNARAVPEYIAAYLNSKNGKGVLQNMCKSIIGMANINAQELQNISILIPPAELQSQYARVVQEIEGHIQKMNHQLATSEVLFQSLLYGYFGKNS
jgi:type I restriction enzyme, S subunit